MTKTIIGTVAIGLIWAALGFFVWLQVHALRKWTGVFLLLSCVPVAGWAVWAVLFAIDVIRDPTSHNLFPFEIAMGVAVGGGYLALLALTRRVLRYRNDRTS